MEGTVLQTVYETSNHMHLVSPLSFHLDFTPSERQYLNKKERKNNYNTSSREIEVSRREKYERPLFDQSVEQPRFILILVQSLFLGRPMFLLVSDKVIGKPFDLPEVRGWNPKAYLGLGKAQRQGSFRRNIDKTSSRPH